MIEPFFFGQRGALAFYHPSNDPAATRMAVICPPFFDEYRRTYRALSDLANACATNGIHVIRIDYSGTGESQGLLSDIKENEWVDDINRAIEEGIDLAGVESTILVGVRFGATLAAQSNHPSIHRYVFWDPVEDGSTYLSTLAEIERQSRKDHLALSRFLNTRAEDINYACFPLTDSLTSSLASLTMDAVLANHNDKVWVVSSSNIETQNPRYRHCEYSGYAYDWPAYHDGMLTPKPVLERIAKAVLLP